MDTFTLQSTVELWERGEESTILSKVSPISKS